MGVLYICLDWALRLMHPLLPYLTEELYQRLPASPTKCQSITVAPFPVHVLAWENVRVEAEMEVVGEIAKRFRSQRTSLDLKPADKRASFVWHADPGWRIKLVNLT